MNRQLSLLILVLMLVVMPYGALPTPLLTTPAGPAQQAYRIGALEEGALRVYTSLNDQEARLLLDKFRYKYPFLRVDYFRAGSADVLQKVLIEAKAGTPPPDVVELDAVDMLSLYNEELLAAYKSPEAEAFPDGAKHPCGYYTTCYVNGIVIAYNTKLVAAEEAPKNLNDLLNARWTGKIGIEAADWALMPLSAQVMGDEASSRFWTKLGEQQLKVIKGHTEVAAAVASGDVVVSPTTYEHRIEALKQSGQPVEWVRTDPVYTYQNSVAITARAAHPNAARVFINWLLSAEGQTTVAGTGRIPIRPGIRANPASLTEGVHFYYGDPRLIADASQTRSQYSRLFPLNE